MIFFIFVIHKSTPLFFHSNCCNTQYKNNMWKTLFSVEGPKLFRIRTRISREGSISPKAKPTAFRALSNRSVATHLTAAPLGNLRFP